MLFLIANHLYSSQEFANLNCQKINAKQFTIQGKLFNIGTSYRNRRSALRAIEDYLQEKIFAFLVEDRSKSFVTIIYSNKPSANLNYSTTPDRDSISSQNSNPSASKLKKEAEIQPLKTLLQYRGRKY